MKCGGPSGSLLGQERMSGATGQGNRIGAFYPEFSNFHRAD